MARTLTILLPHNLGEAEAKRRLVNGLAEARQKFPGPMSSARETWTGNRMDFTATAMGQKLSGSATVEQQQVKLEVELPFMLAMLAERIRPQIEAEGRRLLGSPVPPGSNPRPSA